MLLRQGLASKRLGIAAAVTMIGVLAGPVARMASGSAAAGRSVASPYDRSRADQALATFDRRHADCALWSDWHKLCNRTGLNGTTSCRTDRKHPVKPSAPFCAAATDNHPSPDPSDETRLERSSRLRFSAVRRLPFSKYDLGKTIKQRLWASSRPFSGHSFDPADDPYCAVWWYPDPAAGPAECSSDRRPGMTSYQRTNIGKIWYTAEYPVCMKWRSESQCSKAEAPAPAYMQDTNSDVVIGGRLLDSVPVTGQVCLSSG